MHAGCRDFDRGRLSGERLRRSWTSAGTSRAQWDDELFRRHGLTTRFPQCNSSFSAAAGTLRGLHYQAPPHGEAKYLRCIRGRLFDVVVDVRAGSPSFGRWMGTELSAAVGPMDLRAGRCRARLPDARGQHGSALPRLDALRAVVGTRDSVERSGVRHPVADRADAHVGQGRTMARFPSGAHD